MVVVLEGEELVMFWFVDLDLAKKVSECGAVA